MEKFSKRVQSLMPEGAYFVLEKAKRLETKGKKIIHLEIGQPDFPTFENISTAGIQAIQNGHTHYTPSAGSIDLRQAIAEDAGGRRNVNFTYNQVVVGPGAKPALFFPTLALIEPGDEVIYPDPGFPTYKAMIEVAGGTHTRLIILNSPSNPTGGVISQNTLEYIAEKAIEHDFWVLSDEIYSRLVYEDEAPSIISLPGMEARTIICDGFSKTYSMTGWRLGYGIMPTTLAERVSLLLTHSVGSTADFTQVAGIEAIQGDQIQVEKVVEMYRERRDVLVQGLNNIPGISCRNPKGAFYVFPNVSSFGRPSVEIAEYILEYAGVALLPGTSFGDFGEGYLRLCFANSLDNLKEAIEKISAAMEKL
ncbi:MAG: pyridoxal phosphate-dependent aminotransferase [Anaerolineales bacterium]